MSVRSHGYLDRGGSHRTTKPARTTRQSLSYLGIELLNAGRCLRAASAYWIAETEGAMGEARNLSALPSSSSPLTGSPILCPARLPYITRAASALSYRTHLGLAAAAEQLPTVARVEVHSRCGSFFSAAIPSVRTFDSESVLQNNSKFWVRKSGNFAYKSPPNHTYIHYPQAWTQAQVTQHLHQQRRHIHRITQHLHQQRRHIHRK